MTAAVFDIQLEQGETWDPVWTMTWPGAGPFNLTGYQAHMQFRSTYYASAILANFDSNAGTLVLGGVNGTLQPILPAATSATLISGQVPLTQVLNGRSVTQLGVYDLKLTDPSGNVTTIMAGNVWMAPQATVGGA